ncbi:O-succinylbenzoic acid--CoA ligase [Nocardioides zeae]|uniref:O-succinylbenzoic acid--CoA ligase n=1 Tax=Nocardioides zeae TaxID=1457234 RepID=A0ACC6IMD4_9ACTN|nr:AMP-binding protein [Nocardioides zeae]MDR6173801.1 O-succinylbenzoic acid--CoA ligase [Nocardioides zeae]MDR6211911.1 O-succinylbenzoic acid--CoA ligase [Nocardioides zeae]
MPSSALRPVHGSAAEVVEAVAAWLAADPEPDPLVVETSGSTGRPKRVRLSRRAVLASGAATAEVLGASGQWLLALPATYVAGVQVVARSLTAGHRPVLLDDHADLAAAAAAMTPGVPHLVSLVPTQLLRLLDDPATTAALRGFHTVLLGGGPIDPALRERAEGAGVRVVATYGSAETAGGCVYDGWPLPGVRLRTDAATGRLEVAGPTLFDGYDGDPELTADVLRDGWFRTSDAARLDADGRLTLLGRLDDMVVSGGVNVPTPAVARRLRAHPDVAEAEVLGVPDEEWGQAVVAFVVPRTGASFDPSALRAWVVAEHPRTWAPRRVLVLDAIPLLPNGKTDRVRLREGAAR